MRDRLKSLLGHLLTESSSERTEAERQRYINYYRCPYDGTKWVDVWSCRCNGLCPKCGTKDIEPYKCHGVVHTPHRAGKGGRPGGAT